MEFIKHSLNVMTAAMDKMAIKPLGTQIKTNSDHNDMDCRGGGG